MLFIWLLLLLLLLLKEAESSTHSLLCLCAREFDYCCNTTATKTNHTAQAPAALYYCDRQHRANQTSTNNKCNKIANHAKGYLTSS